MALIQSQALNEVDVAAEPVAQFQRWFDEAKNAGLIEPTAMALATVGDNGRPSVRMVLFKGLHEGGFCFYTNYGSRKGAELTANPYAALTFWWDALDRQVRIEGRVERVSKAMSDRYFHSRPRGSQVGAYTSRQSASLPNRAALDERLAATEQKFAGAEIPLPEWWGGFRVMPDVVEFWQGRTNRVHDRLVYRCAEAAWTIERLQP